MSHEVDANFERGTLGIQAIVNVIFASETFKTIGAFAIEIVVRIAIILCLLARSSILARVHGTGIIGCVTNVTHESGRAFASEIRHTIRARGTILTGIRDAFVDISLAIRACESRLTDTEESIALILARGSILTRIRGTFIDIHLTTWTRPSRVAVALESSRVVLASSTQTRGGFAFIDVLRTKFPRESLGTLTFHGLRFGKIAASGSILTKIASQAIIRDDLAKLTSESNGTRALVEIRSRLIGTNASIDTRNRIAILRRGAWG